MILVKLQQSCISGTSSSAATTDLCTSCDKRAGIRPASQPRHPFHTPPARREPFQTTLHSTKHRQMISSYSYFQLLTSQFEASSNASSKNWSYDASLMKLYSNTEKLMLIEATINRNRYENLLIFTRITNNRAENSRLKNQIITKSTDHVQVQRPKKNSLIWLHVYDAASATINSCYV